MIAGLCPSVDVPEGDWTFTYTVYGSTECTGEILNDGEHNFVCFDANDLASQNNPNASVEPLVIGANANHVICFTENASKTWEFTSCALATTSADADIDQVRYDCGCEETAGVCGCGGLVEEDLEEGCFFEDTTCEILCVPDPFLCAPDVNRIFVSSSPSPSTTNTTTLFELDTTAFTTSVVAETEVYGYDAIGLNPVNGQMYGIANRIAGATDSFPHLLRFNQAGEIFDLGPLEDLGPKQGEPGGIEWLIGTFLEDGTYVVAGFGNPQPWHEIDVQTLQSLDSGTLPSGFGVSAWAAHPTDGLIHGYDTFGGRLVTFDPSTNTLTAEAAPLPLVSDIANRACSSAFDLEGQLYLYCKKNPFTEPPSATDDLYLVDVEANTATLLNGEITGLFAGDMASCVFPR